MELEKLLVVIWCFWPLARRLLSHIAQVGIPDSLRSQQSFQFTENYAWLYRQAMPPPAPGAGMDPNGCS